MNMLNEVLHWPHSLMQFIGVFSIFMVFVKIPKLLKLIFKTRIMPAKIYPIYCWNNKSILWPIVIRIWLFLDTKTTWLDKEDSLC